MELQQELDDLGWVGGGVARLRKLAHGHRVNSLFLSCFKLQHCILHAPSVCSAIARSVCVLWKDFEILQVDCGSPLSQEDNPVLI